MRLRKKNSGFLKRFSFQIVAVFVLIIVFVLGSALSREIYREYEIKQEIDELRQEIEGMENENYELSQLLDYYQTEEYKQSEARQRLNLKADGEKVVMIEDNSANMEEISEGEAMHEDNVSNYIKWWNYFFATK